MRYESNLFERSREYTDHPCPPGTKAIVLCEDFLCVAVKAWDGAWRDKYENVLRFVEVVIILGVAAM